MTDDGVTWTFIACLAVGIIMLMPVYALMFMAGMATDRAQRWICIAVALPIFAGAVALVMAGGGWL